MTTLEIAYLYFVTFVFGCIFGSFCFCVAERIVNNQNFITKRSYCPECKHELSWKDLIPVVSWISTGGKCRYCHKPIPVAYPLTEIIMGCLWILTLNAYWLSLKTVSCLIVLCCLFIITITDLKTKMVPEALIIVASISLIVFEPEKLVNLTWGFGFAFSLWLIGYIFSKVKKVDSLGFGDVEMFVLVGIAGGMGGILIILLSAIIGIVMALLRKENEIPFCPAISIAVYIFMLYETQIMSLYLGMF